jgi:hypothetical protein
MNESEMEEEVRRIVESPVGKYQISLRELWAAWNGDRKSTISDIILLFGVRGRDEIKRREEIETATRERQLEQERLAEDRSM